MSLFKPLHLQQNYLLPPNLLDWIPEDHLARFILEIVQGLDLQAFVDPLSDRDPRGNKAYHPRLLVQVLFYAYCVGIPSSRKIERKCVEDVAFRVLAGNENPDHSTLSAFRKTHLKALAAMFVDVLRLCQKAGLVKVGHVALDGTKVLANASLDRNQTAKQLGKTLEELEQEVERLLQQAESADAAEDEKEARDGKAGLPAALKTTQARIAKLREAREALEAEAKAQAEAAVQAAEARAAERQRQEAETGKKIPGRKPKPAPDPAQAVADDPTQYNETDPDSRIMVSGRTNAFLQGYNAQASTTEAQIILAADVTQDANDKQQLASMVERTEANLRAVGLPESPLQGNHLSADGGYFSETELEQVKDRVIPLVSPDGQLGKCKAATTSPARETMRASLQKPEHTALYKKRKTMIEPIFGQIKENRGFRRFSLRGLDQVDGEWKLICLTHNLLKLFQAVVSPKKAKTA